MFIPRFLNGGLRKHTYQISRIIRPKGSIRPKGLHGQKTQGPEDPRACTASASTSPVWVYVAREKEIAREKEGRGGKS